MMVCCVRTGKSVPHFFEFEIRLLGRTVLLMLLLLLPTNCLSPHVVVVDVGAFVCFCCTCTALENCVRVVVVNQSCVVVSCRVIF